MITFSRSRSIIRRHGARYWRSICLIILPVQAMWEKRHAYRIMMINNEHSGQEPWTVDRIHRPKLLRALAPAFRTSTVESTVFVSRGQVRVATGTGSSGRCGFYDHITRLSWARTCNISEAPPGFNHSSRFCSRISFNSVPRRRSWQLQDLTSRF